MITILKSQLSAFLPQKEISKRIALIRKQRHFYSKYFENSYVERCLFKILETYNQT